MEENITINLPQLVINDDVNVQINNCDIFGIVAVFFVFIFMIFGLVMIWFPTF